jgi:hypothetical protein
MKFTEEQIERMEKNKQHALEIKANNRLNKNKNNCIKFTEQQIKRMEKNKLNALEIKSKKKNALNKNNTKPNIYEITDEEMINCLHQHAKCITDEEMINSLNQQTKRSLNNDKYDQSIVDMNYVNKKPKIITDQSFFIANQPTSKIYIFKINILLYLHFNYALDQTNDINELFNIVNEFNIENSSCTHLLIDESTPNKNVSQTISCETPSIYDQGKNKYKKKLIYF